MQDEGVEEIEGESVPLTVGEVVSDPEVLKDPVTVDVKHKLGVGLTDAVVDEDTVRVPEVQGEGLIVDVEQGLVDKVEVEHKVGEVLTDTVPVEDKHRVADGLKDPVAVEDKHKLDVGLTEVVVEEDPE